MKQPALKITTLLVMSSLYLIIVSFTVFSEGMSRVIEKWGDGFEMTVYLKDALLPSDLANIENHLNSYKADIQFNYIPKSEAIEKFKEEMGNFAIDIDKDPEVASVFPNHYKIQFRNKMETKAKHDIFDQISKVLELLPTVDEVSYGKDWLRKYTKIVSSVNGTLVGLYLALVVTMLFVVGNIIRTEVYSKKDEIEILELVGATQWEIRKPFYKKGLIVSSLAMLIAISGISILTYFVKSSASEFIQASGLTNLINYLNEVQMLVLFLIAIGVGSIGTWLCVNKLNDGWSASQRLS
jgi:cell division transport system permease protein